MRIIAGRLKGRRLGSPRGKSTRPTPAKVREAIFSILGEKVERARVLDLFAGTGALGLEALSRGAGEALFVESDPAAVKLLKKNIQALKLTSSARIIALDALKAINLLSKRGLRFDIVFLDPPYGRGLGEGVVRETLKRGLLAEGSKVVWEHSKGEGPDTDWPGLLVFETRQYGDTLVSIISGETG